MARLAFLGTPEPAALCLAELARAGHEIVVAVTGPDRRRGRGSAVAPTPVKRVAAELGVAVSSEIGDVVSAGADLGVVVAFGRLITRDVLDRLLMVNAHFSLLPRWRGAAPVERAILAGDTVTGVTLMQLDRSLDTGPVYAERQLAILPHESASSLTGRLSVAAAALLVERLARGRESLGEPVAQRGEATYATKISPAELRIDWRAAAEQIERLVRVGRAWTTLRGRRLIIWEATAGTALLSADGSRSPGAVEGGRARTGDGWLELRTVQPEGRPKMSVEEWARGARLTDGEAFA